MRIILLFLVDCVKIEVEVPSNNFWKRRFVINSDLEETNEEGSPVDDVNNENGDESDIEDDVINIDNDGGT